MVFLGNLLPLVLWGAVLASFLTLGIWLVRRSGVSTAKDITPMAGLAALLGAALTRMIVMYIVTRNGFDYFCADESCRLAMAWGWKGTPYLYTFDGVWLTGNFCFFGLLMKWIGSPALALQVGVVLGHVLTVIGAYLLAWVLSTRHWIGAVGAWLVAFMFTFIWIGTGPLVEGLMTAFFMIGLALAWRTLQLPMLRPWCQYLLTGGAALSFFIVTTLHYVGWMALAVLIPILFCAAWLRRHELGRTGLVTVSVTAVFSSIFPLLWCYWSWRNHGSPIAFLAKQAEVNLTYHFHTNWGMKSPTPAYFRCFLVQSGMLIPLACVNLTWRGRGLTAQRLLMLFIPLLLSLMTISTLRGGMAAGVFRNSAIMTASMTILAALSLQPLETVFSPGSPIRLLRKLTLGSLCILLFMTWIIVNLLLSNRYEQTFFGHRSHTTMALGAWLQQEVRKPEWLKDFGPNTRIGFFQDLAGIENRDYLAYKAGCPERLVTLTKEQLLKGDFNDLDYVISELPVKAPGWQQLLQITPYTIYIHEKH